ncbi:hypothetical protein L3V79_09115 [Thiotrichales bacterium 19S9-12]|nr:hypothetical protein [Thiotrichales bacterium 19S9-11]MCF6812517.1 hypothetical protein [Thiotrichales bacterium 19S9-12]
MANPNLIKKQKETTNKILNWLYEFKFSNVAILRKYTGLQTPGVIKALKKLEEKGLVLRFIPNQPLNTVWGITWNGISELEKLDENQKFEPSKFNELTAIHHYNLQELKLLLLEKGVEMKATKKITLGKVGKVPDAIININNKTIAVELERTIKSKQRYRALWGDYIKDIRDGKYTAVQYFLSNKRTKNLMNVFQKTGSILVNKQSVKFTGELKQKFKFTDISGKLMITH